MGEELYTLKRTFVIMSSSFIARRVGEIKKGELSISPKVWRFSSSGTELSINTDQIGRVELGKEVWNKSLVSGLILIPTSIFTAFIFLYGAGWFHELYLEIGASTPGRFGVASMFTGVVEALNVVGILLGIILFASGAVLLGYGAIKRGYHIYISTRAEEYEFIVNSKDAGRKIIDAYENKDIEE